MQLVGRAGATSVGEVLEVELDVGEHAGIEQLAQLLGAEQVGEQVAIERQRRSPALGERGIALVHVGGDPVEQQALRHGRRLRRLDADDPHRPRPKLAEHLAERGHVEHVLQALPRRLEEHGKRRMLGGDGEQVGGALALLPQRGALIGTAPGQEQRPAGTLAEPGREQRGLRQRRHHQLLDVLGIDLDRIDRHVVGRLGQPQHDAVVAPHRLDRDVEAIGQAAFDGHRPRRVHRRAERAQDAHPPVSDLVTEPLDDDRAVVGDDAGRLGLLVDVLQQIVGRQLVERVLLAQPGDRRAGRRRRAARGRTRPAPAPAPAAGPAGRRARTASSPAAPAPG